MTGAFAYVRRLNARPLGRIVLLVAGIAVVSGTLILYPPMRSVVWWSFPVVLFVWGVSRIYYYGMNRPLTVIAACLLVAGGISRAVFQLVPTNELTGTVANLVPFLGIVAETYAHHYRERD